MELLGTQVTASPLTAGHSRLTGDVRYAKSGQRETYWFDVPSQHLEDLSDSGDPWLLALLPLAAHLGEALSIPKPVDPLLMENARGLQRIWRSWHRSLHSVEIEAPVQSPRSLSQKRSTAAFFSGGVDSFFTVLRRTDGSPTTKVGPLHDLISIRGFDIPLGKPEEFDKLGATVRAVSGALNLDLLDVTTNLRQTRFAEASWAELSHGCGLASVALLFQKRYREILIGSTHGLPDLQPWGSHPLTDPLLSTSNTTVVHDGASFTRVEKTRLIAESQLALNHLRVCWRGGSSGNCSSCGKCLRTMATLHLLGALGRCRTFETGAFDTEKLGKVYCGDENDRSFLREIESSAIALGRRDLSEAIRRSLAHSDFVGKFVRLSRWLERRPYVWRWARPLRELALSRSIL